MLELAQLLAGLADLAAAAGLTVYPTQLRAALELAVKGSLVDLAVGHPATEPVAVAGLVRLAQMAQTRWPEAAALGQPLQ
jgi:hypothetical protein